MSLPALVVFSVSDSNREVRYLSFTGPQRQLRFGPVEDVFSDLARFAVEPAGDGLVHIRSCYDNFYWTRASRFEPWLLASNRQKVDDLSRDDSTLFRPRMSAGNVFVSFVHARSGLNVVMRPATDAHAYNLCVEHGAPTEFSYTDYVRLRMIRLPKYVIFLGDNFKSLGVWQSTANSGYPKYTYEHNSTSRDVAFEVFYNKSGDNIRVKSLRFNEFWCVFPPSSVVVVGPIPESDPRMLFDVALSNPSYQSWDGIAIRSLAFNLYCYRWDAIRGDELVAGTNIANDTRACIRPIYLAVLGRSRVNVESLRHAWRGPTSSRVLDVMHVSNSESREVERTVRAQYQGQRIGFSNSFPIIKAADSAKAVFNVPLPKFVTNGGLQFSEEKTNITSTWNWGTETLPFIMSEAVVLKIPPRSRVTATLSVNIATYEVPFSYKQIDELPYGGTQTQDLHDGVYKVETEYGASFSYSNVRPFTTEVLDDENIYTDIQALNLEVVNLQDDGIKVEAKASDEELNLQDDGIKVEAKASDEGLNLQDDGIEVEAKASDEGLNLQDDGIKVEAKASDEGLNVQDDGIEAKASDEVKQEL
ncbi:uncharacterized protein LOC141610542 isoform X3 [Silene latifolia]|uniref:uncharacterized protein LOC141610536 isoform X5 n=1 Tax=Silene latifolia TaxID=37657 RepID=UPI003D780478